MNAGIFRSNWLSLLYLLCFPGLFFDNAWVFNSCVAVMLVMPWIAVARSYMAGAGPIDEIIGTKISAVIALPSASLFLVAVWKLLIARFTDPIPFALAIALVLALFILYGELRLRPSRGQAVALVFFSLLYGYGATVLINSVGDDSAAEVQEAQIVQRWYNPGKGGGYMIVLAGDGPYAGAAIRARAAYESAAVGDRVSVALRKGRLGLDWYAILGKIEDK